LIKTGVINRFFYNFAEKVAMWVKTIILVYISNNNTRRTSKLQRNI